MASGSYGPGSHTPAPGLRTFVGGVDRFAPQLFGHFSPQPTEGIVGCLSKKIKPGSRSLNFVDIKETSTRLPRYLPRAAISGPGVTHRSPKQHVWHGFPGMGRHRHFSGASHN